MEKEYKYTLGSDRRCLSARGCSPIARQLHVYDWLADMPESTSECDLVEVQFKNTRKEYFRNVNRLELNIGDVVAVEATNGHDIGTVSLTGKLVEAQMKRHYDKNMRGADGEIKRVYRLARPVDIEKWEEAKAREHATMIQSRQISNALGLKMKIGDVEYQGDGSKAIFYYIADERVDFRQLIKDLAAAFHVRIEMKQIGARQEAGRIGGFGPCGRELCCATWRTRFSTVSTGAARVQDIPLNPQKLAGQCAKLKCCMNHEVQVYAEASKGLPTRDTVLYTQDSAYYLMKTDILAGKLIYSTDRRAFVNTQTISRERANEIIAANRNGEKPLTLQSEAVVNSAPAILDLAEQDSLTRFDRTRKKRKPRPRRQ